MKHLIIVILILFVISFAFCAENQDSEYSKYWPAWRGPLGTGVAPLGKPPVEWSETKNISWKIPVPGKGVSTPVVWGDKLFITTAVPLDKPVPKTDVADDTPKWMRGRSKKADKIQEFIVLCINRKDGSTVWKKSVKEALPHAGTHRDGTWASGSCITDGKHVFAFFGSYGLYCFDMNGNLKWEKHLGKMKTRASFGEGASPALYKDKLIVPWDHEGPSFLTVFDKSTGKPVWKKERNERTAWPTPVVIKVNGKPQIIVAATGASRGYDLQTGAVIWELSGLTYNVIPTPVYGDGIVYFTSGFRGSMLQAVKLDKAKGNLKGTESVLWTYDKGTPYTPSLLLYKQKLYFLQVNKEKLTCADAKTGTVYYEKTQLEGMKGVYASPVAADGRVYIVGRNGMSYVLEDGKALKVLAKNTLADKFDASPAVVENNLYLRGFKSLYCITSK